MNISANQTTKTTARQPVKNRTVKKHDTLCWKCQKACGGYDCEWAAALKPVDGWKTKKIVKDGNIYSYTVIKCPKFERG